MPIAQGAPVVLAIGLAPGADISSIRGIVVSRPFAALTADLLAEISPGMVLTPLIGRGFDAELVAQVLTDLNYCGHLRVMCPNLPDPSMIAREIRAMAPGLTVDLIMPA